MNKGAQISLSDADFISFVYISKNGINLLFLIDLTDYLEVIVWVVSHRILDLSKQKEVLKIVDHLSQTFHFRNGKIKVLREREALPTNLKVPTAHES